MKKRKNQVGQSLVEVALVLPLILFLVFIFLDLGRAIYFYSALENSVREGARLASVTKIESSTDIDAIKAKVSTYSVAVDLAVTDITVSCYDSNDIEVVNCVGSGKEKVTVSAVYQFTPITPFLARVFGAGNTLQIDSETTMFLAPIART